MRQRKEYSADHTAKHVGEQQPVYGEVEDNIGLGEGVELLNKIYSSGDQVLIRAINANLQAFVGSVENQKRADQAIELIDKLHEKMTSMELKIFELEKRKGCGTPTGCGEESPQKKAI